MRGVLIAFTGGTEMELSKAEEEKIVILLIDFNRKLDLIIEAQASLIKEISGSKNVSFPFKCRGKANVSPALPCWKREKRRAKQIKLA